MGAKSLMDLNEAAQLRTTSRNPAHLRSAIATTLLATDISDPDLLLSHSGGLTSVAVHPNGKLLAISSKTLESNLYVTVLILDIETRQVVQKMQFIPEGRVAALFEHGHDHGEAAAELAFSPDGRWLVAGTGSGKLYRWHWPDPENRPVVAQTRMRNVRWLAFSQDSATLYAGSNHSTANFITRWEVAGWKETGSITLSSRPHGFSFPSKRDDNHRTA